MKVFNFRALALAVLLALLIFVKYGSRWSENPQPMTPSAAAVKPPVPARPIHSKSKKEQERERLAKRRANRGIKLRDKGEALVGGTKKRPQKSVKTSEIETNGK